MIIQSVRAVLAHYPSAAVVKSRTGNKSRIPESERMCSDSHDRSHRSPDTLRRSAAEPAAPDKLRVGSIPEIELLRQEREIPGTEASEIHRPKAARSGIYCQWRIYNFIKWPPCLLKF